MSSFLSGRRKVLVATSQPFHIQYHKDPSIGNLFLILLKYSARSLRRWHHSPQSRFSTCVFDKTSRLHDCVVNQPRLAEPNRKGDDRFSLNSFKRHERIRVHTFKVVDPSRTLPRDTRTYFADDRSRQTISRGHA